MSLFYVQLAFVFVVYGCAAAFFIWLLYKLACLFDDVRYLVDVTEAGGNPVERKRSPLRYVVIVVGAVLAFAGFFLVLGINPIVWLF